MRGHLRQRGKSGAWYAVFDVGVGAQRKQKWQRLEAKTKKQAETELIKVLAALENGTYIEPARMTVREYLETKWIPLLAAKEWAPTTMASFKGRLARYVYPAIGDIPLQRLTGLQLQELFIGMMDGQHRRPLKSQTVRVLHVQLHKAFAQAVTWGLITKNPSDGATVKRGKAAKKRVLTADETAALLDSFQGTDLYLPTLIIVCTGMRRGEVLGLRWADVDLDQKRLYVQQALSRVHGETYLRDPKTDSAERFISLPTILVEALRLHRLAEMSQTVRPMSDLICIQPDGTPMVPTTFSDKFARVADRNGFENVTPHSLRHGHASILHDAGVRDKAISERLGHSGIGITMDIYTHVFSEAQEEAAQKVDNLLTLDRNKRKKGTR